MPFITKDTVEQATLGWLRELGYTSAYGPDFEPESARPARQSLDEAILLGRLRAALTRINTHIPSAASLDRQKDFAQARLSARLVGKGDGYCAGAGGVVGGGLGLRGISWNGRPATISSSRRSTPVTTREARIQKYTM